MESKISGYLKNNINETEKDKYCLELKDEGWFKLNNRWVIFFIFIALLNEIVWRTQSEAFWVNFKIWGLLSITFLFTAIQLPLIKKYKIEK